MLDAVTLIDAAKYWLWAIAVRRDDLVPPLTGLRTGLSNRRYGLLQVTEGELFVYYFRGDISYIIDLSHIAVI